MYFVFLVYLSFHPQFGDEVDALLKQFMTGLRSISTNTLLQAQFQGLEYCWNAQVSDSDLKQLANKFVAVHLVNPNQRSFIGIMRHGLIFGMTHPPTNLKFIELLIPFLQRSNPTDVKQTAIMFAQIGTRCLGLVIPEDRQEDDWEAIQTFADAINKKFAAQVMGKENRIEWKKTSIMARIDSIFSLSFFFVIH